MYDYTATAWQRFARKVTGLWQEPVEQDFAVIAAASLKHEKDALAQPGRQESELAAWEGEGGTTALPAPSPRRSALKHRRSTYNSSGDDDSSSALAK